ncbi:thiamine phosphate synthase [Uliginosibacterium sp. 31-16]|uniref:thiamine phosphate synthase n=1 Tax=Uliginosibacterium sp. 31-16 TaxID=3068315 RepID=UPI00273DA80D|nr:thiamine phosphate synthase [Uliginosibacterium sp. 31-16]MDP5239005.1 thiamine phosphate synthase [Uliginosibacterium sp. 31-16]
MKRGLYLVTPDWDDTARLVATSRAAILGGATVLQYRHKTATPTLKLEQAQALRALTRELGVALIINDSLELALAVDAEGLHIGRDDGELRALKAASSGRLQIGVSCYGDFKRARAAVSGGASYIAFGAMYASPTKPEAPVAPIELISRAQAEFINVPVACIGGITAANAAPLVEAGADWVAVITDIYQNADPQAQAAKITELYR